MASKKEKRNGIGCRANRARIVDPNDFDGFDADSNVPVQLEDLNISVALTSFRKGRTLLTGESTDSSKNNVAQISVNFIEGTNLGGKKVLTTSYTDLTTRFDSDVVNDEALGITNIDIEFNASMAPLITINFIDVRGSAVFQNEENILNNRGNKYTTFFQLPYPMYELEVKGYYGLPVKYCLHMLKFNTKFNSQTGNFEITANFIGYTFALMADMLIGYLKAIPFTAIGKTRMDKYNETISSGVPVLTLSDLSVNISRLNEGIKKVANENPASKEINASTAAIDILDNIKSEIHTLGTVFEPESSKDEFQYIVYKYASDYTEPQKNAFTNQYIITVKKLIKDYNDLLPPTPLVEAHFTLIESNTNKDGGKKYTEITYGNLKTDDQATNDALGNPSNVQEIKEKLVSYINSKNSDLTNDTNVLNIFDMTLLYETLATAKLSVEVSENESKKKLAKAFENEVRDILGFDPTARTIIECFTAAIEVFIETIYQVSSDASASSIRTDELATKFTVDDSKVTDMKNVYIEKKQFFPWPDYREKDDVKNSYVDKYLGAAGVLKKPNDVDELRFIDDLLVAFRKSKKADDAALEEQLINETTWTSVNPIDTIIFQELEPYKRAAGPNNTELLLKEDIVRLMVIRGMIFLGYSNDLSVVTDDEIKAMAAAEVDNMLRGILDETSRQSMSLLTIQYLNGITGKLDGVSRKVVNQDTDPYFYDYYYNDEVDNAWVRFLPTNFGFHDVQWTENFKPKQFRSLRDNDGWLFLTTYADGIPSVDSNYKEDKGGIDMKILTELPKPISIGFAPEGVKTETTMILANLIGDPDAPDSVLTLKDAGYNCFNQKYGIQEFETMDWGDDNIKGLPLMYVFYRDCDTGLAYTRKATGAAYNSEFSTVSEYFYKDKAIVTYPLTKPEVFSSNGFTLGRPMHTNLGKNRDLFNKIRNGTRADVTYPYIELKYGSPDTDWTLFAKEDIRQPYTDYSFSLFGSEFYYNQSYATIITSNGTKVSCAENSRAFLFLQAMPFNTPQITSTPGGNPFGKNEIRHLFDMKAGIIHAPKLWCAYIGSMLWRMDESDPILNNNNQIIGGGVGKYEAGAGYRKGDPIVWYVDYSTGIVNNWSVATNFVKGELLFDIPVKDEYFPTFLDYTKGGGQGLLKFADYPIYPNIGDFDTLKTLSPKVKSEFKKMFFNFVNGEGDKDWRGLAKRLEIFDTNGDLTAGKYFSQYLHSILDKANDKNANIASVEEITTGRIIGNPIQFSVKTEIIEKYYDIVIPIYQDSGYFYSNINDFYLHLQLKDGTPVINSLIDALTEEVFIVNNNYKIWMAGSDPSIWDDNDGNYSSPSVSPEKYNLYFDAITKKLETLADNYNISKQNERIDKEIFNTTNKDIIRLQLYRHCKNVYDKWLGGAKDIDHLVFQCGNGTRSTVDDTLAKKYQNSKTRMIDSFRFVTRSFRDIGNELYINPSNLNDYLIDNPNSSSYDAISSILGANHFNFQALPNFVNFHDDTILESIFKPYNYNDKNIPLNSCGPAFVCVYDGQTSKHLELTEKDGDYPNDGFDLRCMKDPKTGENTDLDVSVPTDFTTELNGIDGVNEKGEPTKFFYEEPVSTFLVRYSQQNQSIFKDIHLDQSEFSETDESLHVQDEISQKGSENNRALVGQNIYNVYAVRSYTAQIEMMGNAMIQPMMYFQLDNIPMFHGAYMITKVSHSIKPNSMSTNFTGTRIRYTETPLIEAYEVYVDLINTMDISEAGTGTIGGGGGAIEGTFEPIVATLIENGVSNAYIDKGKTYGSVTTKDVDLKDTGFSRTSSQKYMISEASDALTKMLKEWSKWMGDNGFQKNASGKYGNIGSLYRTYASQTVLAGGQKTAAAAGTSYHGWGLAVDMSWVNKNGDMMQFNYTNGSIRKDFDYTYNPAIEWLYNNSYRFGFINPLWARNGGSYDEAWHWEYHGTSAKCLLNKSPNVFGKPIDMTKEYDSVVKNPKKSDGSESVYTGCAAKYIKRAGDGSDSSTIVQKTGCPSLPTNGTNKVLSKDMYLELKNITKLSNESISGIMGNLYRESNFNPQSFTSLSGGCGAYGFAQWRGDRLKSLDSLAKSSNSTIDDYKVQLNFMYSELSDYWSYTLAAMKNAKSVEDATKIFATTYEAGTKGHFNFNVDDVLNGEYDPKRIKFAKQYYNMIKTNTFDELKE